MGRGGVKQQLPGGCGGGFHPLRRWALILNTHIYRSPHITITTSQPATAVREIGRWLFRIHRPRRSRKQIFNGLSTLLWRFLFFPSSHRGCHFDATNPANVCHSD